MWLHDDADALSATGRVEDLEASREVTTRMQRVDGDWLFSGFDFVEP